MDKDTWRLRYGELRNVPIAQWDPGAVHYAKDDATATAAIYLMQETQRAKLKVELGADPLADEFRQARTNLSRYLMSVWGLKTDSAAVDSLERDTHAIFDGIEKELRTIGLVRTAFKKDGTTPSKDDGTRDTKLAKQRMIEAWVKKGKPDGYYRTDSDDVSLSEEACDASDDPVLKKYGMFGTQRAVVAKDIPMLRAGCVFPVHTRFDLAASGRRTSSKPNVQNPRRLKGVRECFRPRQGYVYAQADVEGLELCTLAQTCIWMFGHSTLAQIINEGKDAHSMVACRILSIDYDTGMKRKKDKADKEFDNARQTGKVANFGMPGGLGAASLVSFAKATYDVDLTEEQARWLKGVWFETLPEMRDYFKCIDSMMGTDGYGTIMQHKSMRIRGGVPYTAACNTFFQGLGADAMGDAGWRLSRAQYNEPGSVMFGSRTVNDVHDEFIVETKDDATAHDVAKGLEQVIVSTLSEWMPDVKISAPPMLMRYWSKEAKAVYDDNGRLIPWSGT
jgi:hypothetical protein